MTVELHGTVALITGGAKRVGRAIVLELARGGCDVAIHYRRSRTEAEELAAQVVDMGRRAVIVGGDLNDPASWPAIIRELIDRLNRLDVLVNNASAFLTGQPDSVNGFDHGRWESMLRTNVVAPMALSHHARPYLEACGQGKIVNLCDIAADRPWPEHLAYCTSKAALSALTKGLARALAPGIQVNGVAPGIAVFPDEYSAEKRRSLVRRVPLRREGTPEEVARLVRFLVESSHYVTGQIIRIDGGRSLV
ncbi:MAG: SDR family oxidoreductase [Phycisphaerae bacterium]